MSALKTSRFGGRCRSWVGTCLSICRHSPQPAPCVCHPLTGESEGGFDGGNAVSGAGSEGGLGGSAGSVAPRGVGGGGMEED
jgi:hypothetical protein